MIAHTAYSDYDTKKDCADIGFNFFLNKHCKFDELKSVIETFYMN